MTENKQGSKYSFTAFLGGRVQESHQRTTQGNNATYVAKPTPGQIKYYTDLCLQKRVKPKDINELTMDSIGKEIEELRKRSNPPSEKQISKILELQEEILKLGGTLKPITEEFMNGLTGGREGSASALIQTLFEMRTELNDKARPSEEQLAVMVNWFFCPDIPFEDYKIEKKVYIDDLKAWSTDFNDPMTRPWRFMTPDEFADEIAKHMNKREASKFIDDFMGVFHNWRKTRITQSQIGYIRNLEQRLATIHQPKEVQMAIVDGEIVELSSGSSRDARGDAQTIGYTPMEEHQLIQMSYEDASLLIDQMKSEIADKEAMKEGSAYDDTQDLFQDKRSKEVMDINKARINEFDAVNNIVFQLESINGREYEELHDLVQETILDGADERSEELRKTLMSFMMETINTRRNKENIKRDLGRLFTICEPSVYATDIAEEIGSFVGMMFLAEAQ